MNRNKYRSSEQQTPQHISRQPIASYFGIPNQSLLFQLACFLTITLFLSTGSVSADIYLPDGIKNVARSVVHRLTQTSMASQAASVTTQFDIDIPEWDGESLTLNLSDFIHENNYSVSASTIEWIVKSPAFGSVTRAGDVLGRDSQIQFRPDRAGLWEISLVQNGQSIRQPVNIRLMQLSTQHPRIFIDSKKLASLRERARSNTKAWKKLKKSADNSNGRMLAKALVSLVSENPKYCAEVIPMLLKKADKEKFGDSQAGDLAIAYDWCYDELSQTQKTRLIKYFNHWGDTYLKKASGLAGRKPDRPGLGNYWPRFTYSMGMIGLATYGDNPRAMEWIDNFRLQRWPLEKGFLDFIATGGGWPEGIVYDGVSNFSRMRVVDAWTKATGENLFLSSNWFKERFPTLLMQHWPGIEEEWGHKFHPYSSNGDYERNRGTMDSYVRIAGLILIEQFPEFPLAKQLQAYWAAPKTAGSHPFIQYAEFLWFNKDLPATTPRLKAHFDQSTGNVFFRSGWPDGAADLNTNSTHINFRCGDFFTYHQHFDQNSFTLFKKEPLALDSGVYSGNGTSTHDSNYYIRTIAHNTLVVYNENEDLSNVRYNAFSNDGGQRAVYPATRAPSSLDLYQKDKKYYDTGDILAYSHSDEFSYVLGDATKAYNNTRYNQAMDTKLKSNEAKLEQYQREFLYLRPLINHQDDYVVLYDRVAVTKPEFSGDNTKLLFHVQNQPTIDVQGVKISAGETLYKQAEMIAAVNNEAKLLIYPMLPENSHVRIVGGRGNKSYWVFNKNYNWHWKGDKSLKSGLHTNHEKSAYGEWRVEIEPGDKELKHNFLTVLFPTSTNNSELPKFETIQTLSLEGVHIHDPNMNRIALFHPAAAQKNSTPHIKYQFEPSSEQALNIIFGLIPGERYTIESTPGKKTTVSATRSATGNSMVDDQGILRFSIVGKH